MKLFRPNNLGRGGGVVSGGLGRRGRGFGGRSGFGCGYKVWDWEGVRNI